MFIDKENIDPEYNLFDRKDDKPLPSQRLRRQKNIFDLHPNNETIVSSPIILVWIKNVLNFFRIFWYDVFSEVNYE